MLNPIRNEDGNEIDIRIVDDDIMVVVDGSYALSCITLNLDEARQLRSFLSDVIHRMEGKD